jgi:hypothetical protein
VISKAAIRAVTDPHNLASPGDPHVGVAVDDGDVVAELRRLEGLGAEEARRLGREAVIHVGGHIERTATGGIVPRRLRRRRDEVWWVPRSAIRS